MANRGDGTRETTSAPDSSGNPAGGAPADSVTSIGGLKPEDFKKDGTLRADTVRRIEESTSARTGERSYNEVTGETTVTTVVDGKTVTFTQSGDTRGEPRERATDSAARAQERSEESEDNGE